MNVQSRTIIMGRRKEKCWTNKENSTRDPVFGISHGFPPPHMGRTPHIIAGPIYLRGLEVGTHAGHLALLDH